MKDKISQNPNKPRTNMHWRNWLYIIKKLIWRRCEKRKRTFVWCSCTVSSGLIYSKWFETYNIELHADCSETYIQTIKQSKIKRYHPRKFTMLLHIRFNRDSEKIWSKIGPCGIKQIQSYSRTQRLLRNHQI